MKLSQQHNHSKFTSRIESTFAQTGAPVPATKTRATKDNPSTDRRRTFPTPFQTPNSVKKWTFGNGSRRIATRRRRRKMHAEIAIYKARIDYCRVNFTRRRSKWRYRGVIVGLHCSNRNHFTDYNKERQQRSLGRDPHKKALATEQPEINITI